MCQTVSAPQGNPIPIYPQKLAWHDVTLRDSLAGNAGCQPGRAPELNVVTALVNGATTRLISSAVPVNEYHTARRVWEVASGQGLAKCRVRRTMRSRHGHRPAMQRGDNGRSRHEQGERF